MRLFLIAACLLLLASSPARAAAAPPPDPGPNLDFDVHTIRAADVPADAPTFSRFATTAEDTLHGAFARPQVDADPRSRMFRTVIREGAREGANFAGHYKVVTWGCGTGCVSLAIVDGRTGRVFFPANLLFMESDNIAYEEFGPADDSELLKLRLNSRLLVVIGGIDGNPALRGISYFVWQHDQLRRIRFVPRP